MLPPIGQSNQNKRSIFDGLVFPEVFGRNNNTSICDYLLVGPPFGWDTNEFLPEFGGKWKRFNEQLQDLTASISIMSYRRSAQDPLACVEDERRCAQQIKKVIFPFLETEKLKQDRQIGFWGVLTEELWKVVCEFLARAEKDSAIGGIMIHCYRFLLSRLSEGASSP